MVVLVDMELVGLQNLHGIHGTRDNRTVKVIICKRTFDGPYPVKILPVQYSQSVSKHVTDVKEDGDLGAGASYHLEVVAILNTIATAV